MAQAATQAERPAVVQLVSPTCHADRWRALALFLCFAGFYLLTTSGHFYAVDEETLYVLTESLGERHTFELPRGAWGLILSLASPAPGPAYSIFPPGQPIAALPLFMLGRLVAPAFPADQRGYVLRFFVSLFNPLVTALATTLLYRLARCLGYRGGSALALAAIYGLATTAWAQGRTFFAEPFTALLLICAFYGMRRGTGPGARPLPLVLAGLAAVASLTVKPHAAIALPALGCYLLGRAGGLRREGGRWRFDWRAAGRAALLCGAGGVILAVPYAALNIALFGKPLSTGYGTGPLSAFTHPFLRGLYGLTFSTGRGIFWFSPPIFLAVIGARRFYRRHRAEALACLGVVVSHYAFYCGHVEWAGGGAWGPRYLMIALPFALLPILGFFELLGEVRWLRAVAAVIVVAGVVVQLLPVLVNFDFDKTPEETRNFSPSAAPFLWHARTIVARVGEWRTLVFPPPNTAQLARGFGTRESDRHAEPFPRWTNGAGEIDLYPAARGDHLVKLTFFDHRPPALRIGHPTILINGVALADGAIEREDVTGTGEGWVYQFTVPTGAFTGGHATVTLRSATWNPAKLGLGDRDENLGVFVHNVEVWRAGQPLTVRDTPEKLQIDPMPDTPHWRFWWFNDDYIRHHLTDTWQWYAGVAGFPRQFTIRWIGSISGGALLLIVAGLTIGLRSLPARKHRLSPRRQRRRMRPTRLTGTDVRVAA